MAGRRKHGGARVILDGNLDQAVPPGHALRGFVERHAERLKVLAPYGPDFIADVLDDLSEESDPSANDVHFHGGMLSALAHNKAAAERKPLNKAAVASGTALLGIAEDMGYKRPYEGLLRIRLDLSGNAAVDRYAQALAEIAGDLVADWVRDEFEAQAHLPEEVRKDRMYMHGVLLGASRLSELMRVGQFLELFDPRRWTEERAHPVRVMIRHFAGLDVRGTDDPEVLARCAEVHAALKGMGLLDLSGMPEFVPLPVPLSEEEERNPLFGIEDHAEELAELEQGLAAWERDARGQPDGLGLEVTDLLSHEACMALQRRGAVDALQVVTAHATKDGWEVPDGASVEAVAWHLTERGARAVRAASGRMAMAPR